MNEQKYLSLDGRSLRVFLTVLEEMSVSKAATKLGVTQSSVSHTLDRLRQIVGNPLFVKAGRGITATEHAIQLGDKVKPVLENLKALTFSPDTDLSKMNTTFRVLASDLYLQMILPRLYHLLEKEMPNAKLIIIPNYNTKEEHLLRGDHCDIVFSTNKLIGTDTPSLSVLKYTNRCYYNPKYHPSTPCLEHVIAGNQIQAHTHPLPQIPLTEKKLEPENFISPKITTSDISSIPSFMRNNNLFSILPNIIAEQIMHEFSSLDLEDQTEQIVYMSWHQRTDLSPSHRWFRDKIIEMTSQTELSDDVIKYAVQEDNTRKESVLI